MSTVSLKLKSPAIAYIDWANVYGWRKSLKAEVDPRELFSYLREYKQVVGVRFYFGTDAHEKSMGFLEEVRRVGYSVVTKPVKHILLATIDGKDIYRRKCDFGMEICIDVHRALKEGIESFVFFTGDGDFEPLYRLLISEKKQVIVVYTQGHLGREVWDLKRGIFKVEYKNIVPPVSRGA